MSIPIKPMLLTSRDDVADATRGEPADIQPKLDGWRMIIEVDAEGKVRLWGRSGAELTHLLPELVALCERTLPPGTILDGEAMSLDDEWGTVQSVMGGGVSPPEARAQIRYACWDVMEFASHDMAGLTFDRRRPFLERLVTEVIDDPLVWLVPSVPATQEAYDAIIGADCEGAVVKLHSSIYRSGARGAGWFRVKPFLTIDAVAMQILAGEGKLEGSMGSIILGQFKDGVLTERGGCGTGFTDEQRQEIWDNRLSLVGEVFTARYFGCTGDPAAAVPRTPAFLHWRNGDKLAIDCEWEVLHR